MLIISYYLNALLSMYIIYFICVVPSYLLSHLFEGIIFSYVDESGVECDGVATLFAATEARSFCPCFDQPDMKDIQSTA